ncbi:LysR substrate-binding domain-containing protein [Nakamurella leprariae]|uniref:LysR family transcriptional regulator n=1 Tax=Nakamurella leprariae TaxID=2803911 RepID=A0A938YEL1_9ACTN|nr:LysR substrate-binding domain-containing protein [Nakamurella leprariae]MBM9468126.1 LysR family transcriptional regulator [Nakamurella leprariae]
MELRHLRYFVAVAEALHFRKAAENLHMVQPALSKQIRALEAELGLQLLERDRRHVSLTEAGKTFLEEAHAVLARADGAKARAVAVSRGEVGALTIGFIQPALADLLPRALRRYRREYPDVRVRLTELTNRQGADQAASRTVHCAFVRLPVDLGDDLAATVVSQQDVAVVLPEGHPLAERDSVDIRDLAEEDLVLVDRRVEPQLHDYYVTMCQEAGFSPHVAHEVNSTWVAIGLVASGLGVCFAPTSAKLAPQGGVAYRPLTGAAPRLRIGLVWNDTAKPAVLSNFLAMRPWESRA